MKTLDSIEEGWLSMVGMAAAVLTRSMVRRLPEQYFNVLPKWLDEEFPLPAKSEEAGGL